MKLKESVSVDEAIELLNELAVIDQEAIKNLISSRVTCNDSLCDHPSVQVTKENLVGLLGVMNGLFGICPDGFGAIVMVDNSGAVSFERHVSSRC